MRILAIETSTREATVALADDTGSVLQLRMPPHERTVVWLAQGIEQALAQAGWDRKSVELVALTAGPGSFTGLRIAVTTAKMLAFAWSVPIAPLDTLEVVAAQAAAETRANQSPGPTKLTVAMDAQRDDVFAADFECANATTPSTVVSTRVQTAENWLDGIARESNVMVAGPALSKLQPKLPPSAMVAPPETWSPRAETVAALAAASSQRVAAAELIPNYYRKSYAERNTP